MMFRIEVRWPHTDILPETIETATATAATRRCKKSLEAGCVIHLIRVTGDDGSVSILRPAELLRLAQAEGCRIRYLPSGRKKLAERPLRKRASR
jgi:hypothetical protein